MKLKGTSAAGQSTRQVVKWDVADKIRVYALVKSQGVSAKEAFETLAREKGVPLPASYTGYPHSHIWRFQKELAKRVEKGDQEVIDLLRKADLIEDDQVEATEPEADSDTEE